jgi:hypothetical protein
MIAIHIKEAYADALTPLEPSVEEAIRRLAIERATRRIAELEQKLLAWQEKYHGSYDLIAYRTATDEGYVTELNARPETQQWEADLAAWEFYAAELGKWQKRLQNILTA